jgi:hypothetical protein
MDQPKGRPPAEQSFDDGQQSFGQAESVAGGPPAALRQAARQEADRPARFRVLGLEPADLDAFGQ